MATATAVFQTSGFDRKPTSGYRITGGSVTDRLTIEDVITALSTVLAYDEDTGVVTRAESSPTSWQFAFGGTSETAAKNCFIELSGITFQLESNLGEDNSSLDLGNETDKIIFDHQCDVIIGKDNGVLGGPDNGNVTILSENYSSDFYNYSGIFSREAKILCRGYLIICGRYNSRVKLVNSNPDSILRLIMAAYEIHPYLEENGNMGINVDLDVAEQEVILYIDITSFRTHLLPGGLQGNRLELRSAVTDGDIFRLYFNRLDGLTPPNQYTVGGLEGVIGVGSNAEPALAVAVVDTTQNSTIIMERYGAKRGDAFLQAANNNNHLIVRFQQRLKLSIRDALGVLLAVDKMRVEAASTTVAWSSSDNGTPVVTKTDYGSVHDYTNVSEQEIDLDVKIMHSNEKSNQDTEFPTHASIVTTELSPARYSAWKWGRVTAYRIAFDFPDEQGEQDLASILVGDLLITAATKAAVPAAAATYDDVYDLLAEYAQDNEEDIAGTVTGTTLEFEDDDLVLALGGSLGRSGGTVTIPCAASLDAGTKITKLKATGDITVNNGVTIGGALEDSIGSTAVIQLRPSNSADMVALFSSSNVKRGGGTGDLDISLTAAQAEDGLKAISIRKGRVPLIQTINAGVGGVFTIDFGALRQLFLPDGTAMLSSAAVDSSIDVVFTDADAFIDLGNKFFRVQTLFNAFETALLTDDGLEYLVRGGVQITFDRSPTAGDSLYLNQSDTKLRRDSVDGGSNSGVIATVFHPDDTPVNEDNGDVQIAAGVQLTDFAKAVVTDLDLDPDTVGLQSLGGLILSIADTLGQAGDDDLVERSTALQDAIGTLGTKTVIAMLEVAAAALIGNTTREDQSDGSQLLTVKKVDDDTMDLASAQIDDDGERTDSKYL